MTSRLHKWGSIFSRLDGLLQHGGIKNIDKPLWYDIYAHFPPVDEPNFGRPAKEVKIKKIFYPEDVVRAEVHKLFSNTVNLIDLTNDVEKTNCQKGIELFNAYVSQGLNEKDSLKKVKDEFEKTFLDSSINITKIFSNEK